MKILTILTCLLLAGCFRGEVSVAYPEPVCTTEQRALANNEALMEVSIVGAPYEEDRRAIYDRALARNCVVEGSQ